MAAVDVIQALQGLQHQPSAASPFLEEIKGPLEQPDGTDLFWTALKADDPEDLAIAIGSWTLRLIPTDDADGPKVPVRAYMEHPSGKFRSLEIDIGRLELEAALADLIAADLIADPYAHLTRRPNPGPVRLLGPGFTLILRGAGLTEVRNCQRITFTTWHGVFGVAC